MGGSVIWLTGLSGAGKSTIGKSLATELRGHKVPVLLLDGDAVREAIQDENCGHNYNDRLQNAYRICRFAKLASDQGITVVVATMSMFHQVHEWNRDNLTNYFEVFLDVEIDVLKSRDPKGLYDRFGKGEEKNMTGLDITPEFPKAPHLLLKNNTHAPHPIEQTEMIFNEWSRFIGSVE